MFDCNACTLRAIRAIAAETGITKIPRRLLLTPILTPPPARRAASTVAASSTDVVRGNERYLNAAQIRHHRVRDNDEAEKYVKAGISASEQRAIQKELRWLSDSLKFAEHVHYTIRCDKLDKALELCRAASKEMDCVVAWNHLIDYYMKSQKINEAIKIYNEMKKRAQFPDSYTYMILLRGFVGQQNHHRKEAIKEELAAKAVSIYTSMNSPTSRVKHTIMHTNAVLRVCSFAQDMDAFWGVASTIPARGPQSADAITYTTILQAIKHNAVSKIPTDLNATERVAGARRAVHEAKKVWQEVIQKWRAGEVKVDEELVCSMARVLLLSDRLQDWDDIFSLIKQTMQIERLIAPIGSPERQTGHVPQLEAPSTLSPSEQEDHDGYVVTPAGIVFNEVRPLPPDSSKPDRPTSLAHAQPGNDTLSVLIEACFQMRTPKTANAYWDLLTNGHGVKPDLANFHAQLGLLRINRSSARAIAILRDEMPKADVQPKVMTFRLAMATCMRDKDNHNVLDHAKTVVDVMEATVADLDVHTLTQYFKLALLSDDGPKIVATLNRLDTCVHNLRSLLTFGSSDEAAQNVGAVAHQRMKEDAIDLFAQMIGAIDTLMNRGLVPRSDFNHWHGRRSQLTTFIRGARRRVGEARERLDESRDQAVNHGRQRERFYSEQESRGGKKLDKMNKGSWELMMFRKRNATRRTSQAPAGDAWGARPKPKSSVEMGSRPWARGGGQKRGKEVAFADSPAALGM